MLTATEREDLQAREAALEAELCDVRRRLNRSRPEADCSRWLCSSNERLGQRCALFEAFTETLEDVFWLAALGQEQLLYLSPAAEKLYGRTLAEMRRNPEFWLEQVLPADRDRVAREASRLPSSGVLSQEYRILGKDGSVRWLSDRRAVVSGEHNEPTLIGGMVTDITRFKQVEEALFESRERLRLFIDQAPFAIQIFDKDGFLVHANPAWENMWNVDSSQVIGVHNVLREEQMRSLEILSFIEKSFKGETVGIRDAVYDPAKSNLPGEKRWLDAQVFPLKDASGQLQNVVICTADVTERKREEKERAEFRSRRLHAQKMESLGELAGGVAHDFNNLLTAILGHADIIQRSTDPKSSIHRAGNVILGAARRAADLTAKLLGFARRGKLEHAAVDMHQLITDTLTLLSTTFGPKVEVRSHLEARHPVVMGDPSQLELVLINLAINARDAMPEGGRLVVRTSNEPGTAGNTTDTPTEDRASLVIEVEDTGVGIPVELHQRVFEPFFTTKPPSEGTGMGLAMIYGIVTNHGGAVRLASEVGSGTSFTIRFPATARRSSTTTLPEPQQPVAGSGTVLVVDDDPAIQDTAPEMLSSLGYTTVIAPDGNQALALYADENNRFDLVILDITMPGMNGYDCLAELVKLDPRARVLISSGHALDGSARDLLGAGAIGFLKKPYDLRTLGKTVAAAFCGMTAGA